LKALVACSSFVLALERRIDLTVGKAHSIQEQETYHQYCLNTKADSGDLGHWNREMAKAKGCIRNRVYQPLLLQLLQIPMEYQHLLEEADLDIGQASPLSSPLHV